MAITILVSLSPKTSLATETDSYTYSCIQIEDSSTKINMKLNEIFRDVVAKSNRDLVKHSNHSTPWQFYIWYHYYKEMFVDNFGQNTFSEFETCINTNKCEGWPYFERIYIYPSESVYALANYNLVTKNHVAANIEACGVRFSTDKLTHLLKDGFRLFYAKKERGYSDLKLVRISQLSEETFFGKSSTGVFSRADMQANISGAKLFENLFQKHITKKGGRLEYTPINICNYINPHFDERIATNQYSESPKKVRALLKAIEERKNSCFDDRRDEILARKPDPLSITMVEEWVTGISNIKNIFNSELREVKKVLIDPLFESKEKYDRYPVY